MNLPQAQYLLRCDDLCPTISRQPWQQILRVIQEFGIRPILAVVPANRDVALEVSPADPGFWKQMQALQTAGAMIGLHGYRHLCRSRGKSLLQLNSTSEFAGVPAETQQRWIRTGLGILHGHGLDPRIWVAPRHGFDLATLKVLGFERVALVSDGFAQIPFIRAGLTWIPQQLWGPMEKSRGLWTICIHPNTVTDSEVGQLSRFIREHAGQFTSVDRVLAELRPVELGGVERAYDFWAHWRLRVSRIRRCIVSQPRGCTAISSHTSSSGDAL